MLNRDCQPGGNGWQVQSLAPVQFWSWNSNSHCWLIWKPGIQELRITDFWILRGFLVSRFITLRRKEELRPRRRYSPAQSRKRKASLTASADPIEIAGVSSAPT